MKSSERMISHPIPPVWDANSCILILGSFPSVKSRENGFFYGHPQNRFWRVLANIYRQPLPYSIAEKKLSCSTIALLCGMSSRPALSPDRLTAASGMWCRQISLKFYPMRKFSISTPMAERQMRYIGAINTERPAIQRSVFPLPVRPMQAGVWSV